MSTLPLMEAARRTAGSGIRALVAGPAPAPAPISAETKHHDGGLFGPDSVTWRVHADMALLVGGLRSLLVQTLHPLAMAGVEQHSRYRSDPLGRLQRTAAFIATTTYGSTSEALAAIDRVRRMHRRVQGTAPGGRYYSAEDPDLLAWVHYVEVHSFLTAYQALGPGLGCSDADRYVDEMARFGQYLGVREALKSAAELEAWARDHPAQCASAQARAAVRFLLAPPLPLPARAPYALLIIGAISLIPLKQRLALGLWLPGPLTGRVAVVPAARALVRAMGWAVGPSPALTDALTRLGSARAPRPRDTSQPRAR